MAVTLELLSRANMDWAAAMCREHHYLRRMPDPRTMPVGYLVMVDSWAAGLLLFGRPEATRCRNWYGSVADVITGRCEVTRWQVLNLSRVLLLPAFQRGGAMCEPGITPGFVDREGEWHSALASMAIRAAMGQIGFDYLTVYPPVFLNEPFQIRWLMSYCDTRLHRGVIYQASGFERYETGNEYIQTWRVRLPGLDNAQVQEISQSSQSSERARRIRAANVAARSQLKLFDCKEEHP